MISYFQHNFSFVHGVMEVAPGSQLQLANNNLATERHWYWHENENLREKIKRLVAEKSQALEVTERAKAELKQYHAAEKPLVVAKETEKPVGGSGARSDIPVEASQAHIQTQSANSLDVNERCSNIQMGKNQRKKDVRINAKEEELTLEAMKTQLSDAEQKRQLLQEQLTQEQGKSRALAEQKQSAEKKSIQRARDVEEATKKVTVLESEKEGDMAKIALELAQCRLDLAKAQTAINQRNKEDAKRLALKEREDGDVARIAEDLMQCKVELDKAQATVAERDEEVFKMGKAKEYEVRVLVKMLAKQEQMIDDMQGLRGKDSRKIKTLEDTCHALRERLSAKVRPGSSMQLRSRTTNKANNKS
ncbi:hypothetical protein BGZ82_007856 [Podila clonocystis]|nr:hypothetical protein BGZ82_007856 [Podila clonocystis]